MKYGNIACSCGKEFSFETVNNTIKCIQCGKVHDVSSYPEKVKQEQEPEETTEGETSEEGE